jgi:hypothetical protein
MGLESEMSVVIPVRLAGETVARTIGALLDRRILEVIAVVSSSDPTAQVLRELKYHCEELVLIEVEGDLSVPQLRAHGIRRARGRLVAITEDHCTFSESWPAALAPALENDLVGAAGGAVINGRCASVIDWAIYFSRYAGFMPPLARGPVGALAGNNACYRRELLESFDALYTEGFWEHEFHRHLIAQGLQLWAEPDALVAHRKPYGFWEYCALRYRHGRCYAGQRRETLSPWSLAWRVILAPLLPLLSALRSLRSVLAKRNHLRQYFLGFPLLVVLYAAWAAGELSGYLRGPGTTCSETD